MVTGFFLVQADSEAFFLSKFFSGVSRSAARPTVRHPPSRQTRQFSLPHHHLQARRPVGGRRPSRQVKSLSQQARPGAARLNTLPRTDPGAAMKLDYSGWTPIGFDEYLPAKLKRGIKTSEQNNASIWYGGSQEYSGSPPLSNVATTIPSYMFPCPSSNQQLLQQQQEAHHVYLAQSSSNPPSTSSVASSG